MTTTLLQTYQNQYSNPYFKRLSLAVGILLLLSVLLCFVFQFTTAQMCHTKALIIFLTNLGFWLSIGVWLARLGEQCYFQNQRIVQVILVGIAVLALNQVLVRTSVNTTLALVYGCRDLADSWLSYLFTNNIVINALCVAAFAGFGAWKVQKGIEEANSVALLAQPPLEALTDRQDLESQKLATSIKLGLKNGAEQIWLESADIIWIEADNNCITFVTNRQKIVSYQSLRSVENDLAPAGFVRIHRSILVNSKAVVRVINLPTGDGWLELSNGDRCRLSRTYRKQLNAALHS
jgi:LytTr DNA-binding domain